MFWNEAEVPPGLITTAYLIAGILFILSLGGLSKQETARRGNLYGILGMGIAILATFFSGHITNVQYLIPLMLVGGTIGAVLAKRVEMTSMPELVAILHSFVGAAAVLVGIASFLDPLHVLGGTEKLIHDTEVILGVFIGGITFTGSVVAFGKLRGSIASKPLLLPARHLINLCMLLACLWLGYQFLTSTGDAALWSLLIITAISLILGVHLILAIGGADMPVVVSMLNSYSGWAAAASGFMLHNDLLIITGALVGSSGAILSYIMCKAMNRSLANVIFGGFGTSEGKATTGAEGPQGTVTETSAEEVAELLTGSNDVVIVPGYGMAVAQAQHVIQQITENLRARGVNVRFAIHPVAGRLPGHMNVLLAEANVPYDIVLEMDEINGDLPETDLVLVVGANDIVNPSALEDASSPIAGMPVIEAWNAKTVVALKRSMAAGYSGVENPLYFKDNTRMLFGDAKATLSAVASAL